MGTSGSYGGPRSGSPLVPSWLDDPNQPAAVVPPSANVVPPVPNQPGAPTTPPNAPAPAIPTGGFTGPRISFNRFARSGGGGTGSLRRGVSNYVSKTTGSARNAAARMGSSAVAGGNLVRFLNETRTRGVREALRTLDLERLAGRPIEEVFVGLADYICPAGGTVDEGISRDAFMETIVDLGRNGITSLDGLTVEQMQTVVELYATHAIEARLCNDIGTQAIVLPSDVRAVAQVQSQLRDFIRRGVSDALTKARDAMIALTPNNVLGFVQRVYESAFEVLRLWGESEGDDE